MTLVWSIAALYVVVLALLWAFQERITFPAPRAAVPDPQKVLGFGELVELVMRDGTRLRGWYLPPEDVEGRRPSAPAAALLWFYGNGENIAAIWPIVRDFRPKSAALLIVDYPGYGGSSGRTSEAGIYEAGDLAYNAVVTRPGVDPQRIYVYGRSLGSAVATHVAVNHEVRGLILESPFTSAHEMASRHYRLVPSFLVRLRLDNLGNIRRIRCPVLILHGNADALVPIEMGQKLAVAAPGPGPVEFVTIEGAGHNDTYERGGTAYRDKIAEFVRRLK
jgi:fermentation-respiration switch protein FrsA (DUF1100 family)